MSASAAECPSDPRPSNPADGLPAELNEADREEMQRELARQLAASARKPSPRRKEAIGVLRSVPRDSFRPLKPARVSPLSACLLAILFLGALDVARARYVCQSFKDGGHFFYGMDVDRCTRAAVMMPGASFEEQLAALNASY